MFVPSAIGGFTLTLITVRPALSEEMFKISYFESAGSKVKMTLNTYTRISRECERNIPAFRPIFRNFH